MIQKLLVKQMLIVLCIAAATVAGHAANFASTGSFKAGNVWQEVGYVGLGNQNEVLAFGEYTGDGSKPEIGFTLLGGQSWVTDASKMATYRDFVSRVCVWARVYDGSQYSAGPNTTQPTQVATTFAKVFDYRDPVNKSDAILLAQTSDLESATQSLTSNVALKSGTRYVIYITADIKQVSLDKLPEIGGPLKHYTEIGANITKMGSAAISPQGSPKQYGSRVLVPVRKVLYAPGDYYSKFYRIPSIATASDGSLVSISDARKYHIHDIENDIDMLARRSTDGGRTWSAPVTIAKGSGGSENMRASTCANTNGYGDAALVALPNGDLMCTMVHGYRISGNSYNKPTTNWYTVSHDNGQTWSALKQIPEDLYTYIQTNWWGGTTKSIYRGCIAPGNMLLVTRGALKGKVLACFRSLKSYTGDEVQGNFFLCYDPAQDSWSRITASGTGVQKDGRLNITGSDDEAHLLQTGDNTFLLSTRSNNSNYKYRNFATLTYASGSFTVNSLGSCGMDLQTATNGEMIAYTAQGGDEYYLHTIPTTLQTGVGSTSSARSGLVIYRSQANPGAGTPQWTPSLIISDPYGTEPAREETAQYSSFTQQADGTLGILFEEYPTLVRINISNEPRGDYMMETVYMNLRIGDVIASEKAQDKIALDPPVMAPASTTYDYSVYKTLQDVTVTSRQSDAGIDRDHLYTHVTFAIDTGSKTWTMEDDFKGEGPHTYTAAMLQQLATKYGLGTIQVANGTHVQASAYCYTTTQAGVYKPSTTVTQNYFYVTPTRRVMVIAKPLSSCGSDISISAFGQKKGEKEVLVVGKGTAVTVNAPAADGYRFVGFDLGADLVNNRYSPTDAAYKKLGATAMSTYQIQFNMPDVADVPNNYDDGNTLVVYAWYEVNINSSLMSKVYFSLFNSAQNLKDDDGKTVSRDWTRYYTGWTGGDQTRYKASSAFPQASDDLSFGTVETAVNKAEVVNDNAVAQLVDNNGTALYPTGQAGNWYTTFLRKVNINLNVAVMPDAATAQQYNAIVMLRKKTDVDSPDYNSQDGYTYLTRGEYNKAIAAAGTSCPAPRRLRAWNGEADGTDLDTYTADYAYYLLNGAQHQFASDADITTHAIAAAKWYSGTLPVLVKNMVFNNLADPEHAVDGKTSPWMIVDIFVVNNDANVGYRSLMSDLVNDKGYVYKVSHWFAPNYDAAVTAVSQVEAARAVSGVTFYNLAGMSSTTPFEGMNVEVTRYTDGSTAVRKFINNK